MTEDQIERIVSRRIDAIDKEYLTGGMTDTEYNTAIETVDLWADRERKNSSKTIRD